MMFLIGVVVTVTAAPGATCESDARRVSHVVPQKRSDMSRRGEGESRQGRETPGLRARQGW